MVLQYKCPSCGADMVFDSQSGMLVCESCGHQNPIESTSNHNSTQQRQPQTESFSPNNNTVSNDTTYRTYGESEAIQYQCGNCGAILITTDDTTATLCSFCGASMVLGDRLAGSLAPAKVIPFSISKEQAQEAFKKWCRKGHFMPKQLKNADRIKNITGIYIPFWLFDLNGFAEVNATCTRVRRYESGDYIYTQTKYYDIYRKVNLNYLKVPVDASIKMDDKLMDKLEPFDYSNLKEFQAPYLAGYIAEKYNYTDSDLFPRVKNRIQPYIQDYIASTIKGYASTTYTYKNINIRQKQADYTLLPIWMICYDYKNTEHNFMMNGQTGKIVGKPPLSKKKIAIWWSSISISIFIILLFFI